MEELIFYADKIMVMGNSKNLRVFNFAILLISRKSWKLDAHEIYMFYSSLALFYAITSLQMYWQFGSVVYFFNL